jgi:hypothetical protein
VQRTPDIGPLGAGGGDNLGPTRRDPKKPAADDRLQRINPSPVATAGYRRALDSFPRLRLFSPTKSTTKSLSISTAANALKV